MKDKYTQLSIDIDKEMQDLSKYEGNINESCDLVEFSRQEFYMKMFSMLSQALFNTEKLCELENKIIEERSKETPNQYRIKQLMADAYQLYMQTNFLLAQTRFYKERMDKYNDCH